MKSRVLLAAFLSMLIAVPAPLWACTSMVLNGTDSGRVYGRTLEFGVPLKSEMMKVPRGYAFQGIGIDGVAGSGKNWVSKYSVVGANGMGQDVYADGMNEVGLVGGLLNAPNTAKFQNPTQEQSANSIAPQQILLYALTNFATVDEAKAAFPKMYVNSAPQKDWGGVAKFRMTLHDTKGGSLVIEYLDGKLVMTDNIIGTMTNDPPFAWHLANIGNYVNLSGTDKPPMMVKGVKFPPASSGNGLHGLPGSLLSSDRFVRASIFVLNTPPGTTDTQEKRAWHIMNNFDLPYGAIHLDASSGYGGGVDSYEISEWTAIANMKTKLYSIRTFESPAIMTVGFKDWDLNGKKIEYSSLPK